MNRLKEILAFAIRAATEAGALTLPIFHRGADVDFKEDDSPVTVADRQAETHIRNLIEAKYPKHGILGEEFGQQGDATRRWVIDPIDGTKSFICGVPLYAVLLSFEEDGVPLVGVAYFPALNQTFWATQGEGAFHDGVPARVSTCSDLKHATLCTGSLTSLDQMSRLTGTLNLAKQARAIRTWGDAYGHCLVASGRVEAMIDPRVAYYDLSAVSLIVSEAGGQFTDFRGVPGIASEAISTNEALHDTILAAYQ